MSHTKTKSARTHGPVVVNTKGGKSSLTEKVVHNVGPEKADLNPGAQKLNRVGNKGART